MWPGGPGSTPAIELRLVEPARAYRNLRDGEPAGGRENSHGATSLRRKCSQNSVPICLL